MPDMIEQIYGLQGIEEVALRMANDMALIIDALEDEYPEVNKWANLTKNALNNLILAAQEGVTEDTEDVEHWE